jgi:O-antigen/teichoic acid export membrane protein
MQSSVNMAGSSIRHTLVSAACLGLQPLLLSALSLPAMAYIIHRMGPERFAQWTASSALLTVFALIANLGLRSSYVRTISADPTRVHDALAEQLSLRLALTVPAGGLVLATCLAIGYPAPVLRCAAIAVAGLAFTTAATTFGDTLQSFDRVKALAGINLVSGVALTGASLVAARWDASPEWMAAAYLVGPVVGAVLSWRVVSRHICRVSLHWSPGRFTGLLKESRHFAAQQLLVVGSNQAEGLISPRLLGMTPFGSFAAGAGVASRLFVLPDALCTVAFPSMVRAFRQSRRDGAAVALRCLVITILAGVAVAVVGAAIAGPLGHLLLPARADTFVFVMRLTIWAVPLLGVELVLGYALNAAGGEAVQARLALPAAALTLAASIVLVLMMGIEGACWSMVARPALRALILAPVAIRTFWRRASGAEETGRGWVPLRRAG